MTENKTPEPGGAAQKAKTKTADPAALMYVGPAIMTPIPLMSGAVFAGGLPTILGKAVEQNPDLAALFLPLDAAGPALRAIEDGKGELMKHVRALLMEAADNKRRA